MDSLTVDFSGEKYTIAPTESLVIGRSGHIAIDDNPYLHRQFLRISRHDSMWWLANIGSRLSANVSDDEGSVNARLAPGAQLPIMFHRTYVWFTAGATTYEFEIVHDTLPEPVEADPEQTSGPLTIARIAFTPDQKRLIVALCEPSLRHGMRGAGWIPSSADAASRLGWTITRFNRKLDNVCEKLARAGFRGLHGERSRIAVNRRAQLVELAIAMRMVQQSDLDLLETLQPEPDARV
jgi:hypothetical protein